MRTIPRRVLPVLAAGLAILVIPPLLEAQAQACRPRSDGAVVESRDLARLPVDRIADLLALEPGVVSLEQGDLSVRGAGPGATGTYLDGVPVTPGHRGSSALLGGSYSGDRGTGIGVGTNAFDQVLLYRGPGPAEVGTGRGGVVQVITRNGCEPREGFAGGLATDAVLGKKNGLGFNRLTLDGGHRFGKFYFRGATVLEGLSSERLGLEQNASPVFVAAGVDTTVAFDPGGGTIAEDITRFRQSPGIRIPSSAASSYTQSARLGYDLAPGQQLELAAYASQRQDRLFDYEDLYNPRQLGASRSWSRVVTGSWFGHLKAGASYSLRGEAHLSWQTDRLVAGPLSPSGEKDSRDPFGGFLIAPVGFRFDFDNFAVNEELVRNFRTNTGRRSPYDLDNTSQYSLIDQYRNNAYGLTGFTEAGGPTGQLTLSRENRLVGKAVVDAGLQDRHHLRVGFELTRYDIDFYQSGLTSQALANAYVESPRRHAIFGDYTLTLGDVEVDAGLRFDHFSSGASRPVFPRISSAPGFDPANPTAGFIKDKAHSRLSPRARGTFRPAPRLRVEAGLGTMAQLPDFAATFAGINTDLSTTLATQVFGTDLDFEHATLVDLGGSYALRAGLTAEADAWYRKDADIISVNLVSEFDPLAGFARDIYRARNHGGTRATGLDLRLRQQFGTRGQGWIGYSYSHPTQEATSFGGSSDYPATSSRQHTVAGAVLFQTGEQSRLLGGLFRNAGLYGTARIASGTAYTRCPIDVPEDDDVLSDDPCTSGIQGNPNGSRLPALKLVDLRLTREITVGRTSLVAFVDVRNLLNTRNVTRVFSQTGTTVNTQERLKILAGNLNEFENEATANGVRQTDGSIDLSFGGVADPRAACGSWTNASGTPTVPNCIYLIGAEERWGNGDHLFSIAEQTRASDAYYNVARGLQNFTGSGRRVRLGLELRL
jgi:TonB-dependent Receptor Plug Domain